MKQSLKRNRQGVRINELKFTLFPAIFWPSLESKLFFMHLIERFGSSNLILIVLEFIQSFFILFFNPGSQLLIL